MKIKLAKFEQTWSIAKDEIIKKTGLVELSAKRVAEILYGVLLEKTYFIEEVDEHKPENWVDDAIKLVESADIKEDDWMYYIFNKESLNIPDYWLGHFTNHIETFSNSLSSDTEDFRLDILRVLRDVK